MSHFYRPYAPEDILPALRQLADFLGKDEQVIASRDGASVLHGFSEHLRNSLWIANRDVMREFIEKTVQALTSAEEFSMEGRLNPRQKAMLYIMQRVFFINEDEEKHHIDMSAEWYLDHWHSRTILRCLDRETLDDMQGWLGRVKQAVSVDDGQINGCIQDMVSKLDTALMCAPTREERMAGEMAEWRRPPVYKPGDEVEPV